MMHVRAQISYKNMFMSSSAQFIHLLLYISTKMHVASFMSLQTFRSISLKDTLMWYFSFTKLTEVRIQCAESFMIMRRTSKMYVQYATDSSTPNSQKQARINTNIESLFTICVTALD